ncbi:MAG: HlyD family efflux transporter periplasmic adaptor subunit [Candidatus Obscuribacterales bacterium]|nr:HlyD family efflux transporter periplasmic adaptor subunit [Candidatus Obscuribacterales bacterium]
MQHQEFSQLEKSNQISEQMQFAVFESHGQAAQLALYALGVVMIVGFIWAALVESDICAEATGKLEPLNRVQFIQPAADGTIAEYRVRDGQHVSAGEILVLLNTVRAEAELNKKEQELFILEHQLKDHEDAKGALSRIIANPESISDVSLAVPESYRIAGQLFTAKKSLDAAAYDISGANTGHTTAMSPQMAFLRAQRQALNAAKAERINSVKHRTAAREAERKKLEARAASLEADLQKARIELSQAEASLADAKKEMDIYEKGRRLGVASEVKFLDVKNYMNQREYAVAQLKLQISDLEQAVKSAHVDLESKKLSYNAERLDMEAQIRGQETQISSVPLSMNESVRALEHRQAEFEVASYNARARYAMELKEISSLEKKIIACQAAVNVLKVQLSERFVRSPIDGIVSDLTHLQPGQIVTRGQTLMTIVPSLDELVLRAEVNNKDVGFIEVGQEARLKVDAFPCEEFGIIPGKVLRVGNYPEHKIEAGKRVSVYKVKIRPNQSFLQVGNKRYDLKPGLMVHADIILRKRSWLALLFEPLLKISNN